MCTMYDRLKGENDDLEAALAEEEERVYALNKRIHKFCPHCNDKYECIITPLVTRTYNGYVDCCDVVECPFMYVKK